jgi:hypothetical protein
MVKLVFYGTTDSGTYENELELFVNAENEIYISITDPGYPGTHICLDRETAIKLSKELRKQIALIQ